MLPFFRTKSAEDCTDEQLLARYTDSGDARSLGILYGRYMPMVYGVCLKITKDQGKAEDAVMSIYEELARKVKEHQIESFRGWLYVLARNHCLMEWRKKQRHPTDHYAPEDMARHDAVEDAFEVEIGNDPKPLEKCLAELQPNQQTCVKMFYYEDKSYKEIADFLAQEVGTVRSYIQNGRRNLRICLEKK